MREFARRIGLVVLSLAVVSSMTGCHLFLPFQDPPPIQTHLSYLCKARIFRDLPGVGERFTEEWQAYTFPDLNGAAEALVDCETRLNHYIDEYLAPGFQWRYEDLSVVSGGKTKAGCGLPNEFLMNDGAPLGAELRWENPPAEEASAYVYLIDEDGEVRTAEQVLVKTARIDVAERTGYPSATGLYEVGEPHLRFSDLYVELAPFNLGDIEVDTLFIQSLGTVLADKDGPDFEFSRDLKLFIRGLGGSDKTELCISDIDLNQTLFTGRLHQGLPYAFFTAGLNVPIPELGPEGRVKLSLSIPTAPAALSAHQPYVKLHGPKIVGTEATLAADIAIDHDNDIVDYFWFKDFEKPSEVFLGKGNPASASLTPGSHEVTVLAYDPRGTYASATATFIAMEPIIINSAPHAENDTYTDAGENLAYVKTAPGVLANDSDENGETLTAQILSEPSHGTVLLSPDGGFTYTPSPEFSGLDSFTYRATDGQLESNAATVSIQVNPEPDAFRISHMGPDGNPDFRANEPALAYNPDRNEFLAVWSADHNAGTADNEFEIWGQRLEAATGGAVGTQIRISDMGPNLNAEYDAFDPAVVYNSVRDEYLVVWVADDDTGLLENHELEIFGQRLDALGNETGFNDFRISDMGVDGDWTYSAVGPAVAHNSARDEYLVVWGGDDDTSPLVNDEYEIFGQRLSSEGLEIGLNDYRISDMGPDGDTSFAAGIPDVVFNPVRNEYLVVWAGDDGVGGGQILFQDSSTGPLVDNEVEIFGQRLGGEGTPVGTNDFRISDMGPDGDTRYGAGTPVVAHQEALDYYFVAWSGDDDTGTLVDGEYEIFGQILRGDGSEVPAQLSAGNDFRISETGPDGDPAYVARDPAVAYNAGSNEFLVTWRGVASSPTQTDAEYEVYGERLLVNGVSVGLHSRRISHMGPDGDATYDADSPAVAANPGGNEWLVAWSGDLGFPPLVEDEFEVLGYKYPGGKPADFSFINTGPTAENDSLLVAEGGTVNHNLLQNDSDPDGDELTAPAIVTLPEHGSVVVHSPHLVSYTHNGSETISDSFTYETSDGERSSNVAVVDLTVTPVNDPPIASNDPAEVERAGSVEIPVLANDTDAEGSRLFPIVADPPLHGSALEVGNTIIYTHDGSDGTSDSFTYWASDGAGLSGAATVTVSVSTSAAPAKVALLDPATGQWHFRHADGQIVSFYYGVPGDVPLLGDWDCDGIDTVGLYRPSTGFAYLRNSNTFGVADQEFFYGIPGDVPLAGDWNGDGCDTLAIYRTSQGTVYVSNQLGTHPADLSFYFGIPGDKPFVGDFNGDGMTTFGLYRDTSGFVYFRDALSTGFADFEFYYGIPSDRVVAGDWDGDGDEAVGIFRPSEGRFYLSNANVQGFADITFDFGQSTWLPVSGDFGPD